MNSIQESASTSKVISKENAFNLISLDNDILLYKYHDKQMIMLEDVKRAFELYEIHSENYKKKVLLSFGPFASIRPDARSYAENIEMPTPAQAVILQNLSQRILARFYRVFRKDKHPLKFFSDQESAIEWLKKF